MSKSSIQVDSTTQSDSDLSLQLSDASSLSSDSDLSEAKSRRNSNNKKKPVKKTKTKPKKNNNKKKQQQATKKDVQKYCICRKGYDGKEFMIECEDCKEWFHGACVGLKPNSVSDHYACSSCTSKRKPVSAGKTLIPPPTTSNRKKSVIVLPVATKPPPTPPQPIPVISKLSIQDNDDDDEDEDLDDICVLCDGDCTCNVQEAASPPAVTLAPSPPTPPAAAAASQKQPPTKLQTKIIIPVPKKSSKAITSKKSRKSNKWTIHNTASNHDDDSDDDDSNISISDSQESESDDEPVVVERVGINTKKNHKSKAPKKKMPPKKSTPRRGKSKTVLASIVRQKAPPTKKGKGKKMAVKYPSSDEGDNAEDSDEELIVDDLDDLLETMSPLSEHSSNESDNSLLGSEEFFTDDDDDDSDGDPNQSDINAGSSLTMSPYAASYTSSIHLDSGDDEDIENVETQKIINEWTLDSDEEINDMDSDILDQDGGMFVEDEYDDEDQEDEEDMQAYYYARNNSHWSSSSEEEEEEEFDYTTAVPSEEDGNLYDSIAAAFMQALVPMAGDSNTTHAGDTTTGANTPAMTDDYQLSAFELTHALSALSAETSRQHNDILLRRPSLPSSAVSAARRMRGSQDFSTSEALRALSALVSDDLPLALQPIDEVVEDISEEAQPGSYFPAMSTSTSALEQQIQDAWMQNLAHGNNHKRKAAQDLENEKKRRPSRSNSLGSKGTAVSMDDLVDTSQLYTRSSSRSPSPEIEDAYSRDLSRWQRIPIGAFRLMRSKNKLWLER
ncbi:hypothetical protein FB192DRAFT_1335001 [Mucor lusitanicus]|uniref:PHD-type domain-containing protein n=1 Tax=Mucor circinelloides f. lusitanicus TaxID=29924 RepID=A0A8H4B933_MUCCL|nr:hypothetical protein FB192DRAFT_1335001 [Mucor lusitanicus]